ncbi:MAG: hypothetical protein HC820_02415 [Hydrococcus sp. RM1_1_31]|nr:hypothetical protein [Hydrococcus sp. RM1_1_31]
MTNSSPGQMTWKPDGAPDAGMLHLRHDSSKNWQPYTEFPEYIVPDPPNLEFSQGYATFLALLKQQWKLV